MSGVFVLIVVLMLLLCRTRRGRRRAIALGKLVLWLAVWPLALLVWLAGGRRHSHLLRHKRHTLAVDARPGQGPRYFTDYQRRVIHQQCGYRCVYCGSPRELRADHKIPYSKGGVTLIANGQTLCDQCNTRKSNLWSDEGGVSIHNTDKRTIARLLKRELTLVA